MIDTTEQAEEESGRAYWSEPPYQCPCGAGMVEPTESGCCLRCDIEWKSQHQLCDRQPESQFYEKR